MLEQVAEARVRLLGGAEAGELPHRPEPPAVHRRVDAARVRVDARVAEVALVVDLDVVGRVERLDREPGHRREERVALGLRLVELAAPLLGRVEPRAVLGRRHRAAEFYAAAGPTRLRSPVRGPSGSLTRTGAQQARSSRFHTVLRSSRPTLCRRCVVRPREAFARARESMATFPPLRHTETGSARRRAGRCPARRLARADGGGARRWRRPSSSRSSSSPASGASTPSVPASSQNALGPEKAEAPLERTPAHRRRRPHPRRGLHGLPLGRVGLGRLARTSAAPSGGGTSTASRARRTSAPRRSSSTGARRRSSSRSSSARARRPGAGSSRRGSYPRLGRDGAVTLPRPDPAPRHRRSAIDPVRILDAEGKRRHARRACAGGSRRATSAGG